MPFDPLETVPVELLADGRLRTLEPFTWTGLYGDVVLVPAGTITDLASVPWFLRGVIAHDGRIARAAIVHDVLCERLREHHRELRAWKRGDILGDRPTPPTFSSKDADAVFRLILAELGVHPVRRALYWEGVRAGALWQAHRRGGWWRTLPAFVALLPLALLLLPGAVGSLLSGALLALVGLLVAPFTRRPPARRGDAVGRPGRTLRRRAPLLLGAVGTVRTATTGRRTGEDDNPGARPALTGTALERAVVDYFGADPADVHELQAFRAGWRMSQDAAAAGAARARAAAAAARAEELQAAAVSALAAGGWPAVIGEPGPEADIVVGGTIRTSLTGRTVASTGPLGRPLEAHGPEGCTCGAWRDDLAPHSLICPVWPARRPAWPVRAGRALAALPGRAARAIWRALCALGRGVAAFLSALFDAL